MTAANRLKPLSDALGDHSTEGIAILTAEPWRVLHAVIYTMVALVLAALAWSFIGRADVIVTAQGTLVPDSEVRRFYAPVDGELVNLYVAEGQPVSKGDVLARLNARGAIEAAANALQAQLKLENAERDWRQFPDKKALLERKAATLRQAMELEEQQHAKRMALGTSQLVEAQRAQDGEARTNVEDARRARDAAKAEADKFERVFAAPAAAACRSCRSKQAQRAAGGRERLPGGAVPGRRTGRAAEPGSDAGAGPGRNQRRGAQAKSAWSTRPPPANSPMPKRSCGCSCRPRAWRPKRRRASASRTSTRTTSC